jgi:hypothetical protein
MYRHLEDTPKPDAVIETPYYLVLLVAARRLDYSSGRQLLKTIACHPSDGGKNSDVGHAWIMLKGDQGILEGGHTGEFGRVQPRYFDGVAQLMENGDPNPVRYLWAVQKDGCFQRGSGGFFPTFAAKVNLTRNQYEEVRAYILSNCYPYQDYSLTGNQCAVFVSRVAGLVGLDLEHSLTICLEPCIQIQGEMIPLWQDSRYSRLTVSTPDILEKSLMDAVRRKRAENATAWYRKSYQRKSSLFDCVDLIKRFPYRYLRAKSFNSV